MHFPISCSYLPICRLPQPYSWILRRFLLLHSGRPNLGIYLSYLSGSCRVTGKGMSMSQLSCLAWQLWQSHRMHAPRMAIKSFLLFTRWMVMESLSPASPYNPYVFLFPVYVVNLSISLSFFILFLAHALHLLALTDKESCSQKYFQLLHPLQ